MAHVQYQTGVDWDPDLKDLGYTDADTIGAAYAELVVSGIKVTTGAPAATAGKFLGGALITNAFDSTVYEMTGTTASPAWTLLATGGSGITQLTGDVTAGPGSGSQAATIAAGAIDNAKVAAGAAIAFSKLAALPSGQILVGSVGTNIAVAVPMSGDASIIASGAVSVTGLTITGQAQGDILYFNAGSWVRLPIGAAGQVLTVNGGGTAPVWA